jgi:hypothetical protein
MLFWVTLLFVFFSALIGDTVCGKSVGKLCHSMRAKRQIKSKAENSSNNRKQSIKPTEKKLCVIDPILRLASKFMGDFESTSKKFV